MVIKCPNCHQYVSDTASVCPQCGTYLKEDTKGTVNSEVFPGLIAELKKNLMLQGENHSNEEVWTTINWIDQNGNRDYLFISSAEYDDDGNIIKTNAGLVVKIGFYKDENSFNGIEIDKQFTKFVKLQSFPQFTSHYDEGDDWLGRDFEINFAQDVEGAARIITELLTKVKGLSPNDEYGIFTGVGDDGEDEEEAWYESHYPHAVQQADTEEYIEPATITETNEGNKYQNWAGYAGGIGAALAYLFIKSCS